MTKKVPKRKPSVEEEIDKRIGEVRTDSFDISFGEIVSLHENKELIIQPEYQRLFRWSDNQRSQLIESILLALPQNLWVKGSNISRMEAFGFFAFPR